LRYNIFIIVLIISSLVVACSAEKENNIETETSTNSLVFKQIEEETETITILPTKYNIENRFSLLGTKMETSHLITSNNIEEIKELSQWNLAVERYLEIEYSPNGKYIYSTSYNCNINKCIGIFDIRNSNTGAIIHIMELPSVTIPFSISPDSKYLAIYSDESSVNIWDIENWKIYRRINRNSDNSRSVVFSPDGKQLIEGTTRGIVIWNFETGNMQTILENLPTADLKVINTSEGILLASSIGGAGREGITIWNLSKNILYRKLDLGVSINEYSFSPDGRFIAINLINDKKVNIYNLATGNLVTSFKMEEESISNLTYSPDGNILAIGTLNGDILFWDPINGILLHKLEKKNAIFTITFSPDGGKVVYGSSDGIIHFLGVF
jgi:WD40 repeat protein